MNLGFYSYLAATIAYGLFALLLLFSWRDSRQGRLLLMAVLASALWALSAVKITLQDADYLMSYQLLEIVRYIGWYVFLLKLFDIADPGSDSDASLSYQRFARRALPLSVGFALLALLNEMVAGIYTLPGQYVLGLTGNVVLSLIALAILEQLFRNTASRFRWATKYMFLGAGGIFAFDFYLYADALLFHSIDQGLWQARGIVHVVAVPLLAIASARNENWSLNIFVSRDVVFNTTAILAGGFYLLFMAAAGYYVREFGGSWGRLGQIVVITLAVVILFVLLTSSQLRARIRVFLNKHFYKNKYDYRVEWLRLTGELNEYNNDRSHYRTAIQALAQIVDARAGSLWLRDEKRGYINSAVWNCSQLDIVEPLDSSLVVFLEDGGYVINVTEIESRADEYGDLQLPAWFGQIKAPWLVVPLHGIGSLQGFVVLCDPLVWRSINWEDRDLLKIAARQIASHLAVIQASAELAEAKQFEVFSRLSAYMVHDLKNIAAELDLIALNAKKHIHNTEFVADAFETVEHAAGDIARLLDQLRNRRSQAEKKVHVDLVDIVADVVEARRQRMPVPVYAAPGYACQVAVEKSRLSNVLAHLIDNAQEATDDQGEVQIRLYREDGMCVIEIQDNGHGMDDDFIRHRLFKPFDTTKGNAGMGIGMYESREFVRQLGGDIRVQSEPGKGSIISVLIPSEMVQPAMIEPNGSAEQKTSGSAD